MTLRRLTRPHSCSVTHFKNIILALLTLVCWPQAAGAAAQSDFSAGQLLVQLDQRLQLRVGQVERIRPHVEELARQLADFRDERKDKAREELVSEQTEIQRAQDQFAASVEPFLTSEQRTELRVFLDELRRHALVLPRERQSLPGEQQPKRSPVQFWTTVAQVGESQQLTTLDASTVEVGASSGGRAASPGDETEKSGQEPSPREFFIAPIPILNPTIGTGLGVAGGYLYPMSKSDANSPPSLTAAGGFRTDNGSWAFGVIQKMHLKKDKYRVQLGYGYGSLTYKFYGIGHQAGGEGLSIEINQNGHFFLAEGLRRVWEKWFAGARYHLVRSSVALNRDGERKLLPVELPEADIELRTAALGLRVQRDSRDSEFYPTQGSLFDLNADLYGEYIGGRRSYQMYKAFFNKYTSLRPSHQLAFRVSGCFVDGNPPFYDLCLLGLSGDLRGYEVGQYRDRWLLATQAEYRLQLPKRFGLVAFVGVGEVAPELSQFRADNLLPGAGVGLRFTVAKKNHINLRIDYAVGKDGGALYIGVAEAF